MKANIQEKQTIPNKTKNKAGKRTYKEESASGKKATHLVNLMQNHLIREHVERE